MLSTRDINTGQFGTIKTNKMKTIEEKIAVMQAFADGKEIELRLLTDSEYYDCKNPGWNWGNYDYRVKPEPEYIPFTFEDSEFLIGKIVKSKNRIWVEMITWCSDKGTSADAYETLLSDHTFIDGSPCGKLKQTT